MKPLGRVDLDRDVLAAVQPFLGEGLSRSRDRLLEVPVGDGFPLGAKRYAVGADARPEGDRVERCAVHQAVSAALAEARRVAPARSAGSIVTPSPGPPGRRNASEGGTAAGAAAPGGGGPGGGGAPAGPRGGAEPVATPCACGVGPRAAARWSAPVR